MRRLILSALLLAPLAAYAYDDGCKFQAPIDMKLDLAGIRSVQLESNSYDLHVEGQTSDAGHVTGRACTSEQSALKDLTVTQRREGDRLVVELTSSGSSHFHLFGGFEQNLDIQVKLPPALPVSVNVGSGDVWIQGMDQVEAHTGSGDLHLSSLQRFRGSAGSGDVDGRDIGSVELTSLGSGDAKFHDVRQDVRVGSVGSGDATFIHVGGSVRVDTLGSGDLAVREVKGDFSLGAKGSGDVHKSDISGKVSVPHDDDDDD